VNVTPSGPNPNPEHIAVTAMLPGKPAGLLRISAGPDHAKTVDLATLKAMPQKTIRFHNVHTRVEETYTGVPLLALLASFAVPPEKDLHGKPLADYIVATGSDGYKAVLALAEVDPEFHPGDVIVADAMDGKPLDAKNGPLKLVVSEDKRPARSVQNLVSIELKTAE
jgi:DMSO/TMAO reductase YedYZ molybdopterin-dependent catalytic subunit